MTTGRDSPAYKAARAADLDIGATRGIDAALDLYGLDALLVPSEGNATSPAARVCPIFLLLPQSRNFRF